MKRHRWHLHTLPFRQIITSIKQRHTGCRRKSMTWRLFVTEMITVHRLIRLIRQLRRIILRCYVHIRWRYSQRL
ncbi:hypothetical protein HanHA300_Chr16g0631541 [Helianthus annuus]|nr:hypothetical protein HanHA300_Chr16g0631541 [Helianthus annuus]KAJ0462375.1 hypothetical protein HanHA89_Chr16g0682691 [Helianthus annuus]KAJ0642782.1 hypothetical protein HanLR1_Chr16g0642141 [Helianthus annuus]